LPGDLVLLGVFGAPHGVRGEIRLRSYTADPLAIASYGPLTTEDGRMVELVSVRPQNDVLIARVKGLTSRDAAQALTHVKLHAPRERLGQAEEDEFFHADLVGLRAEGPDGEALGTVVALHNFGAADVVEIRPAGPGQSVLLPFTKEVVPVVDIAGGRMVVVPPVETGEPEPGA
jgi:16S rRNA processing protein RimM